MKKIWRKIYLGLGSNLNRPLRQLRRTYKKLQACAEIKVIKASSIYRTTPVGPKQKQFLNAVIAAQTSLSPVELLQWTQQLEKQLGRKKSLRWGPRLIDIDVLIYGSTQLRSKKLTLPHPRLTQRKFVLIPLAEISPRLKIAGCRQNVAQILGSLTAPDQKVRLTAAQFSVDKIEK